MSKKLEEKQRRRLAEERRRAEERKAHRRRNLITLGIALLVGVGVVLLIINEREVAEGPIGAAANEAGCEEVQEFEGLSQDHVDEGTQVDYAQSPPVGGEHWPNPVDAVFYSEPLDEEFLVHNLEHGQIVIWYSLDLPEEERDELEEYVERENEGALVAGSPAGTLLAVPYEAVESGYILTAWEASESCQEVSSEAIDEFRVTYQGRGPEQVGIPPFEATSESP